MNPFKMLFYAAIMGIFLFVSGWVIRDVQWQGKHQKYVLKQQQAIKERQRQKDEELLSIGLKHEQELTHERNTIDQLRAGVRDGTVRLRQFKAQSRVNKDQCARVGDVERAEYQSDESALGQNILDAVEDGKVAIKQRDALQAVIRLFNEEQ